MTSNDSTPTTPQSPVENEPARDPALLEALDRSREKSVLPSRATLGLAGAVLLAGGFLGGYVVKDATTDTATALGGRPGGIPSRTIEGGPAGPGRMDGPDSATFGTVESVDGDTVTVKTASGKTVKVKVADGTKITVSSEGTVSDLDNGDTIIVNGDKDDDGNVTADSITEGGTFRQPADR